MHWRSSGPPGLTLSIALLAACGSAGESTVPNGRGGSDSGVSRDDSAAPASDVPTVPPPETEERRSFETPQAGGRYVYVANPRRDNVAVIDSRTLAIQSVEAGDAPTYLFTVPGRDTALVINVGSSNLTVMRTVEGRTSTSTVAVARGANAVAIAPDGAHAVVWHDSGAVAAQDPSGSLQDISVVTLSDAGDRSVSLTVGYRPSSVSFTADGAAAYVVTEDGVSILRFAEITGPVIVPNVTLARTRVRTAADASVDVPGDVADVLDASDIEVDAAPPDADDGVSDVVDASDVADASDGADASDAMDASGADVADGAVVVTAPEAPVTDVSISPDGRYALARVGETATLRLADLTTRTLSDLDLGDPITDLDLSPDGRFAVAVIRSRARVVRIAIPEGFSDPSMVQRIDLLGEFVGSVTVSPDGRRALLYSTVAGVERMTLWDLTAAPEDALTALRLRKSVRAVAFSPDSRTALVVHSHTAGDPNESGLDVETRIDRSYGYSLIDPSMPFVKLQLTPAEVGPFAIMPDGSVSFVLLRDDARGVSLAQRISMRSFSVDDVPLGSPPLSVGAVPATQRAFIGQLHPEGRITFVDWTTGALQSLTGFELNSRVVM